MPREHKQVAADDLFVAELKRRGIPFSVADDGRYVVQIHSRTAVVNLDNIRRDFSRDHDSDAIVQFVTQLSADPIGDFPDWATVKPFVRYSLESAECEGVYGDAIRESVSEKLVRVFVYTSPDGSLIELIMLSMLHAWRITLGELAAVATANMNELIGRAVLDIEEVDGVKLGMISTEDTSFKASFILSKCFRELVTAQFGWPVYVVVPTRDFVYVLSRMNRDFLGRLGGAVLREYERSGYPITPDVLEVGDHGVNAIGSFASRRN